MINIINIIITSAALVLSSNPSNPVPYCVVEVQATQSQERLAVDFYEHPDGGCKQLGAAVLQAYQEQYTDAAATLTVDGESNNEI